MISYLFEASVYLAAFYLLYCIGLQRDTFFERNRAYLVLSALAAVLLPWFEIPTNSVITALPSPDWSIVSNLVVQSSIPPVTDGFTVVDFIYYSYYLVGAALTLRFVYQLAQLGKIHWSASSDGTSWLPTSSYH